MDSLSELFDEGLDSLLNAAFSLMFVGTACCCSTGRLRSW